VTPWIHFLYSSCRTVFCNRGKPWAFLRRVSSG
jgi:hypothetical protein